MPNLKVTVSSSHKVVVSQSEQVYERVIDLCVWYVRVGSLSVLTQLPLPLISIGQLSNNSWSVMGDMRWVAACTRASLQVL